MTLDGDDKQQEAAKSPPTQVPFPLVGGGVATNNDDSDTDSGSVGDIDDYELEEDDPVSVWPGHWITGLNRLITKLCAGLQNVQWLEGER